MTRLRRFWTSLERIPGWTAVPALWQQVLEEDWAWAQPLLRETGTLASRYPKLGPRPESSRPYRVVCHRAAADDYVGVCPDETGTIPLRAEDLRLHAIEARALASLVADAMGLIPDPEDPTGVPNAVRAGIVDALAGDGEEWVYLFTGAHPGELAVTAQALAARHEYPFLLLTATTSAWRAWPEPLRKRGRLGAMSKMFVAATGGGLRLATSTRGLSAANGNVPGAADRQDSDGTWGADVIVPSGHEELILRILDAAMTLMKMADLEAATEERGCPLTRRTIGPAVQYLASQGLVDRPKGPNSGVRITTQGRRLLRGGPATSQ